MIAREAPTGCLASQISRSRAGGSHCHRPSIPRGDRLAQWEHGVEHPAEAAGTVDAEGALRAKPCRFGSVGGDAADEARDGQHVAARQVAGVWVA